MFKITTYRRTMISLLSILIVAATSSAKNSEPVLSVDHYVRVKSTVPAIAGQITQIYVRERTVAGTALRGSSLFDRVSIVGWSLGGPRAGGYAAQHPEKVLKLVLLAPAYNRTARAEGPSAVPAEGVAMNTQNRDEFIANWDRQVGCTAQYDAAVAEAVWTGMLESDPVGATWGTGVRRAPQTTTWGLNSAVLARMQTPTLLVSGIHDKQVSPDRVREMYTDLGSKQKVFIDLACSSHNAMWEKNHSLLFRASLEWLTKGSVNGRTEGMQQVGY